MTQQGPEPQEAPNPNDIMKDILDRAGLEDVNDVPIGLEFNQASMGVWRAESSPPVPGFEFLRIFGLFQTGDEVRVYAVPVAEPAKNKAGEYIRAPIPYRFSLSKTGKPYFIEGIENIDVFKDEIAADLRRLADETMETLYGEDASDLLDKLRELVANGRTQEALDRLMKEDDEDDEDDDAPDSSKPAPS